VLLLITLLIKEEIKMGHWFGKSSKNTTWRKTPAKVGGNWYTPSGSQVKNPSSYFKTVSRNGSYWKGNTGWKPKNKE